MKCISAVHRHDRHPRRLEDQQSLVNMALETYHDSLAARCGSFCSFMFIIRIIAFNLNQIHPTCWLHPDHPSKFLHMWLDETVCILKIMTGPQKTKITSSVMANHPMGASTTGAFGGFYALDVKASMDVCAGFQIHQDVWTYIRIYMWYYISIYTYMIYVFKCLILVRMY